MNFYPAIDLKDGKCIRLKQGELKDITFYNPNPVDQASQFIEMGAKWIHMVDIEGAFKGKNFNHKVFIDNVQDTYEKQRETRETDGQRIKLIKEVILNTAAK